MRRHLSGVLFIAGLLLLVLPDLLVFYLIMPVPTSQQRDQIELAYFLYNLLWYTRLTGLLLVAASLFQSIETRKISTIVFRSVIIALALIVIYVFGFHFMPETIFRESEQKKFASLPLTLCPTIATLLVSN
jgi:hypothetical protein